MPGPLERLLARSVSFLEKCRLQYMVLGGFALPSYGAIRTTADLDIAVRLQSEREFTDFVTKAAAAGFRLGVESFANPVCVFRDEDTGMEVEFWLRPDGIAWERETLRRRKRTTFGGTKAWIVSPEDFIVSKLARPDRGVQDEKDVAGILARIGRELDNVYLRRRAREAGVLPVLEAIRKAVSEVRTG